ncbi:MAG: inosine/xanthosine triphosphatase [Promethearchaeota archaeon]
MSDLDLIKLYICVGSLNPSKINAVRIAFSKYYINFEVYKIKLNSSIPNQPIGMDLIIKGAKTRAKTALNYLINKKKIYNNIFGVGIEAGLVKVPYSNSGYLDFQFCSIIDENKNFTLGSGIAFEYPQTVINEIFSDKNIEIGVIMGRLANNMNLKNEGGAISFLSKNAITRTEILTQAVISALLPRINKKLYEL